jgi:hypothetical protein
MVQSRKPALVSADQPPVKAAQNSAASNKSTSVSVSKSKASRHSCGWVGPGSFGEADVTTYTLD